MNKAILVAAALAIGGYLTAASVVRAQTVTPTPTPTEMVTPTPTTTVPRAAPRTGFNPMK